MLTKQRCTQTWPGRIMAQRFNIHNIVFASMIIVALLLLVIAESTDHWFIEAHSFETINQGLWKICYYFGRTQTTLCVTPGAVSGMFEYVTEKSAVSIVWHEMSYHSIEYKTKQIHN